MKRWANMAIIVLAVFAIPLFFLWRGAPIRVSNTPAPLPGRVYFLLRQPDQLLALMGQPADLSEPAEKLVHRVGCREPNCNIVGVRINNDVLEYTAMHEGEWYQFQDGIPVGPEVWDMPNVVPGAEAKMGSLYVDNEEVLKFRGSYDSKFAPGYVPLAWLDGDRYLAFYYSGYNYGTTAFLANLVGLGQNRGSCYLWDRHTGDISRFVRGSQFVWMPD